MDKSRKFFSRPGALLLPILLIGVTMLSPLAMAEDKLTMNMRDADIRALIQWVADNTGKNIVVHKDVQGKVNVLSPAPLSPDEAYQVFLSVLQVHGYAAIETPEAVKIIPKNMATRGALPYSGASDSADMVVSVLKIRNASALQIADLLRPMLSSEAVLSTYAATNTLVIADHASNVESARSLVQQLDKSGDTAIEVVKLQYADAGSILQSLTALLPQSAGNPGSGVNISLSADERSNSVLLAGDPARRRQFRNLIRQLDTAIDGGNTSVVYLHYVDAAELVPILQSLTQSIQAGQKSGEDQSSISIESSETANALVINAPPSIQNNLRDVIAKLDIRRAQVLIEAVLVEVRGELANDLGVSWITDPNKEVIGAVNTLGDLPLASTTPNGSFAAGRGFTLGYFQDGDIRAALRALSSTQNANILSTPTVVAIDNEEASLLVGQNVPFITGQATGSASTTNNPFTTIERQDIGTSLVVTPRINEGDSITLEIQQKTENIAPSVSVASDIVTNKREILTKALIKDGQVLVLGGLVSDEETEVRNKVPLLGDIPLLGKLFSSTDKSHAKTNFMVFIHPTILKDQQQIAAATQRRYNFMQDLQQQARDKKWRIRPEPGPLMQDFESYAPSTDDK